MYETRSQKKKNGLSVKDSRHLKNQGKSNNDNNNGDNIAVIQIWYGH